MLGARRRTLGWAGQGLLALACALLLTALPASAAPTVEQLEAYTRQHPDNARAIMMLGRLYAQQGAYDKYVPLFMRLLRKPFSPGASKDIGDKMRMGVVNRVGLAYFKLKNYKGATKVWTYALKKFPDDDFARKGLTQIAKITGVKPVIPGDQPPKPAEPVLPPVSPAEAKKNFDEGLKAYNLGKDQVDQGNDSQARGYFEDARAKLEIALRGKHREAETNYYLGMTYLKEASEDTSELQRGLEYFQAAQKQSGGDAKLLPDITFALAAMFGLLDDNENEIENYEKTLELRPDWAEAHFRASLAYDKAKRPDWSSKSFEHAKKAIKLDPNYKKKFQPMIRNSQVAKKVAGIIHEIIQKSEDSQIPDEEAAKYAEEIGKILGDNNIKSEMLGEEGNSQQSLKDVIKDPSKRQKLRNFFEASSGGDPQKVQDMIDNATPEQKEAVDRILKSDKNGSKLLKQLGNRVQEASNQQPE